VFYTALGDDKARRETERALGRATPFLRRQVGERLSLRRVPVLEFKYDRSVEYQDRVERILRELKPDMPEQDD
jgi:ribosome-binding factor A